MDRYEYYLAISILYFVICCEATRILVVVPTPSVSHQIVFHPLTKELASRGHEVVMITTDPAFPKGQSPPNLTEIDVHDIAYRVKHKILSAYKIEDDLYNQMKVVFKVIWKSVEEIVKTEEIRELLKYKNDHFDLLMIESVSRPALIFSHFFKAPVISISSFGMMLETYSASGSPSHPLLYPNIYHKKIYNLTITEKIVELWEHIRHAYLFSYFEGVQDEMLTTLYGPDVPTLHELTSNIDMFFLNTHPILTDNQPVPPNVVYLGGMHQKPYKELPKDLKSYMDSSKNGVIYMSLGTNIQPSWLSEETRRMLIDVFSKLPYDILLKWDLDTIPRCPRNIKIVKWVPQSDLLQHPAIKLFITQAGLQSTDEAITAGVPLLGLPMLGDQFYNAEKYLKLKIGLKFDICTVTEDELLQAIYTIIEDKSYRNNIIRLRSIIYDQPQSPLERAVWWTEYVLRHGSRHLRSPAANMSWTEYYELKLIFIVLICLIALLVLIVNCLYYLINFLLQAFNRSKEIVDALLLYSKMLVAAFEFTRQQAPSSHTCRGHFTTI